MWSMLRILWPANKSNETVLQEANTTRSLMNRLYKRQQPLWPCDEKREI